jgi:hypothetical protein
MNGLIAIVPRGKWLAAMWLLSVAMGASSLAAEDQPLLLRWKFQPGDRFHARLTQETESKTVANDKTFVMRLLLALEMDWQVRDVDSDGTAQVTFAFTRFQLRSTTPDGKTTTYDSHEAADESNAEIKSLHAALQPLLRSRVNVTMSARGEIMGVQVPADTDSLLRGDETLARLRSLFTPDSLRTTLRPALGVLPEPAVAIGQTWETQSQTTTPLGTIRLASEYRYAGATPAAEWPADFAAPPPAKITMTAKATLDKPADAPLPPDTKPSLLSGIYLFDAAAGHLVQSQITQSLISDASLLDASIKIQVTSIVRARIQRRQDR